jgi:hypothetical protein
MLRPRHIYRQIEGVWHVVYYGCRYCDRTYKNRIVADKHMEKCLINTTKQKTKEENKFMPIQAIMKNGKRMYRWGDSGKLYEKREDAEKQAAAAYASGYKKDGASKKK